MHAVKRFERGVFLMVVPINCNNRLVPWKQDYTLSPPAPLGAADLGPGMTLLQLGFAVDSQARRPPRIRWIK